jgi:ABC-type polysaccharide/polyol phosphate export permease
MGAPWGTFKAASYTANKVHPPTVTAEEHIPAGTARAQPRLVMRLRRAAEVLATLGAADLKLRYGRGRASTVKWLLDPIAATGVYLVLVEFVLDRPGGAWALSIACAVFPFQLVMMTIINALNAVRLRQSIISNMAFPRMLLPVSSSLTESVAFVGTLPVFAVMMAAYGVEPEWSVLWLPFLVLMTMVFAAACAYPAALIGLWFRELHNFVVSGVRTLFFLAAGLIALEHVHGTARDLLPLNPLTGIFEAYRNVLLLGEAPAWWHVLYPLAFAALLFAAFLPIYRSEQLQFAKVGES